MIGLQRIWCTIFRIALQSHAVCLNVLGHPIPDNRPSSGPPTLRPPSEPARYIPTSTNLQDKAGAPHIMRRVRTLKQRLQAQALRFQSTRAQPPHSSSNRTSTSPLGSWSTAESISPTGPIDYDSLPSCTPQHQPPTIGHHQSTRAAKHKSQGSPTTTHHVHYVLETDGIRGSKQSR